MKVTLKSFSFASLAILSLTSIAALKHSSALASGGQLCFENRTKACSIDFDVCVGSKYNDEYTNEVCRPNLNQCNERARQDCFDEHPPTGGPTSHVPDNGGDSPKKITGSTSDYYYGSNHFARIVKSGREKSGELSNFSVPLIMCAAPPPKPYILSSIRFELAGDRSCGSWSRCERIGEPEDLCYKFSMQGHNENCVLGQGVVCMPGDNKGVRESEGTITLLASLPVKINYGPIYSGDAVVVRMSNKGNGYLHFIQLKQDGYVVSGGDLSYADIFVINRVGDTGSHTPIRDGDRVQIGATKLAPFLVIGADNHLKGTIIPSSDRKTELYIATMNSKRPEIEGTDSVKIRYRLGDKWWHAVDRGSSGFDIIGSDRSHSDTFVIQKAEVIP